MTNNLTIFPKNKQIWLTNLVINYLMPSSSSSFSFLCPLVCIINIFLLSSLILPNATVNDSSYGKKEDNYFASIIKYRDITFFTDLT